VGQKHGRFLRGCRVPTLNAQARPPLTDLEQRKLKWPAACVNHSRVAHNPRCHRSRHRPHGHRRGGPTGCLKSYGVTRRHDSAQLAETVQFFQSHVERAAILRPGARQWGRHADVRECLRPWIAPTVERSSLQEATAGMRNLGSDKQLFLARHAKVYARQPPSHRDAGMFYRPSLSRRGDAERKASGQRPGAAPLAVRTSNSLA